MNQATWKIMLVSYCVGCLVLCGCGQPSDVAASTAPSNVDTDSTAPTLKEKANGIVDQLAAGDFAGVTQNFDATMKAALPETALQQTWASLTQQTGPFKNRGNVRSATEHGFNVVYVECIFERATMSTKVVFNPAGEVTGLFIQKG